MRSGSVNFIDGDDISFSNFYNNMQKEFMLGFNHSNARFVDNHVLNEII